MTSEQVEARLRLCEKNKEVAFQKRDFETVRFYNNLIEKLIMYQTSNERP